MKIPFFRPTDASRPEDQAAERCLVFFAHLIQRISRSVNVRTDLDHAKSGVFLEGPQSALKKNRIPVPYSNQLNDGRYQQRHSGLADLLWTRCLGSLLHSLNALPSLAPVTRVSGFSGPLSFLSDTGLAIKGGRPY